MAGAMGRLKARSGTVTGAGGREPSDKCGLMRLEVFCPIPITVCASLSEVSVPE